MIGIYLAMIPEEDDKRKFERIYADYKDMMFKAANVILNDTYLSEDAVQQAFLRIMKQLNCIDKIDSQKTKNFITIVVRNVARTIYTLYKKDFEHWVDDSVLIDLPAEYDLEEDIIAKDDVDFILKVINSFPEVYREVLILKYFHTLKDKEIADVLHISNSTARKRLQRAREMLKERGIDVQ